MITYPYGTAGFRFNSDIILSISYKIGKASAILSIKKNKFIGIMITASHNYYLDNGVKIIDPNGHMLNSNDEEFIRDYVNDLISFNNSNGNPKIVIGMDTRESSPKIKKLIIDGIKSISKNPIIIDLDYVTTPITHFETNKANSDIIVDYFNYYFHDNKFDVVDNVIIDCANGVGSIFMHKYLKSSNSIIINDNIYDFELLNNKCGSDYVCNNKIVPHNIIDENKLMISFDGDADRIVFYFINNNKFYLLDGDRISSLIVKYISHVIEKYKINVNVVHTAYSNGNFIKFLNKYKVNVICTATGVKNLHREAEKADIGIYFEANGHGTVLFNNPKLTDYIEELKELRQIFNQFVGDSISNLVGIMTILDKLKISYIDWYNLYENKPNMLTKIHILDKSIYLSQPDEKKLIAPIQVQNYLDNIMKQYNDNNLFCFVRASGTENILRLYIEIDDNINIMYDICNQITNYLATF